MIFRFYHCHNQSTKEVQPVQNWESYFPKHRASSIKNPLKLKEYLRSLSGENSKYDSDAANSLKNPRVNDILKTIKRNPTSKRSAKTNKLRKLVIDKEALQLQYTFIHFGIRNKIAKCLPDIRNKKFFRLRSPNSNL